MKKLTDCPVSPEEARTRPPYRTLVIEPKGGKRGSRSRPRIRARVERPEVGQVLEIESREPIVAYAFPDENRDGVEAVPFDGKRPEAVLLLEYQSRSLVIFIELKSVGRDGKAEHGVDQVIAGARHFAPVGRRGEVRAHGDDHHDAWTADQDLPRVLPKADHEVFGIVVAFRSVPRVLPAPITIAGKSVQTAVVQVPMAGANRAEIELARLLELAGLSA